MKQIGWYHPGSKRFCYTDVKDSSPEEYEGYTMPVLVSPVSPFETEMPHDEIVRLRKLARKQIEQVKACSIITCECGGRFSMLEMFRCWFCRRYVCKECGATHFQDAGKTAGGD